MKGGRGVFEAGAEPISWGYLPPGSTRETAEAILRLAKRVCGIYNVHDAVPVLPSLWVRTLEAE